MKAALLTIFVLVFSATSAWACPYCVGSSQEGQDMNTTLILALFILSIYIPYLIIYRLIRKQRQFKELHDRSGSANP
jgi:peptidoglycan biosynthesis protein MviN/MurJ (putative lipid II flippase)